MRLHTDNPIDDEDGDKFGFKPYAQVLRDTILETGPLPFCVGIFGEWGSGKTSFMKMIESPIKKMVESSTGSKAKVCSIWFNPWKYDKKEDLWSALIQSIVYEIEKELHGQKENVDKARHLALATTWLAMKKAITALTAGVISESNLDGLIESFGKADEKYHAFINNFEEAFSELVNEYTGGGKLVIFIDDLDRCLPENAITVLESLKLFFAHAQCIFVLGMDHYIVEEGIRSRYPDKVNLTGRDYLDKIVQIPFYLPPVPFDRLKDSFKGTEADKLSKEIWGIVRSGMGGNPRKTKRFINCFSLLQSYLRPQTRSEILQGNNIPKFPKTIEDMHLAKLLVFQISFPDFYIHLRRDPGDWAYLEKYVIKEESVEKMKLSLRDKPDLEAFWDQPGFKTFMKETQASATLNYPPAPEAEVVSAYLQATSLVSETPREQS